MNKQVFSVALLTLCSLASSISFAGNDGPGEGRNPPIYEDENGGPANPFNGTNGIPGVVVGFSPDGWNPGNSGNSIWGQLCCVNIYRMDMEVTGTARQYLYYVYEYMNTQGVPSAHTYFEYWDNNQIVTIGSFVGGAPRDAVIVDSYIP